MVILVCIMNVLSCLVSHQDELRQKTIQYLEYCLRFHILLINFHKQIALIIICMRFYILFHNCFLCESRWLIFFWYNTCISDLIFALGCKIRIKSIPIQYRMTRLWWRPLKKLMFDIFVCLKSRMTLLLFRDALTASN